MFSDSGNCKKCYISRLSDVRNNSSFDSSRSHFKRAIKMGKKLKTRLNSSQRETLVYLRIRPLSNISAPTFHLKSDTSLLVTGNSNESISKTSYNDVEFTFSHVFGPETSQEETFNKTLVSFIKDFFNGNNCAVMTYGISGAGKTYTLMGTNTEPGILPRALYTIFDIVKQTRSHNRLLRPTDLDEVFECGKEENGYIGDVGLLLQKYETTFSKGKVNLINIVTPRELTDFKIDNSLSYEFWVTFLEIYNESVYDLLSYTDTIYDRTKLKICENKHAIPCVKDLTIYPVKTAEEAYTLMKIGLKNVQYMATPINLNSNRSHCIFKLTMVRSDGEFATVNTFKFCDLAGSERVRKSNASGVFLRQSQYINASLHVLNRCMNIIRVNQKSSIKKQRVVPYRESKLTKLFQHEISGHGNLSIIVNINPEPSFLLENMESLNFGAIARDITITSNPIQTKIPVTANYMLPIGQSKEITLAPTIDETDTPDVKSPSYPIQSNEESLSEIYSLMMEKDNRIYELLNENEKIKQEYQTREEKLRADLKEQYTNILTQIEIEHQKHFNRQEELYEQQVQAAVRAAIICTRTKYSNYADCKDCADEDESFIMGTKNYTPPPRDTFDNESLSPILE